MTDQDKLVAAYQRIAELENELIQFCPIGDLDTITSLRVKLAHIQEELTHLKSQIAAMKAAGDAMENMMYSDKCELSIAWVAASKNQDTRPAPTGEHSKDSDDEIICGQGLSNCSGGPECDKEHKYL